MSVKKVKMFVSKSKMKRWYQSQGIQGSLLFDYLFLQCVCLFLVNGNLSMLVKWREMFNNFRKHIGLKFKGNNQQSQIPAEAEGNEIEASDEAEGCLFP